jgi:hypothetical protein
MAKPDTVQETAEALDGLLRGEISAIETYGQAIEKFEGRPELATLRRIRDDHVDSANLLRTQVASRGEEVSASSGGWGAFARAVEVAAQFLGHTSSLQALREGEVHGKDVYENLLMREDVDQQARDLVAQRLLPRQRGHVEEIDRLIARHIEGKKA